jgi:hypothetical protein
MSQPESRPDQLSLIQRGEREDRQRRNEAGFMSVNMALRMGKAAMWGIFITTPIVAGATAGALSVAPHAMSGEISVTNPAKTELLKTTIEQELCIASSEVKVTGGIGFEGHPLDQNMKGNILGVPYNLNLERDLTAEVYRKVRYCVKGISIPYTHNLDLPFGNPNNPAITTELSLSKIIVIVSALHDGRDQSHPTSDGVLGYFASDLAKYAQQKAVQNLVGEQFAQDADIQTQIDNLLQGALAGYLDKEAAISCLRASDKYDWPHSPIGQLLVKAIRAAIQADYLKTDNNRPQPGLNDISVKIVDDKVSTDPAAQILNQTKNNDMENALNLLASAKLEDGTPRELSIAGIQVPITYVVTPPTSKAETCVVTPEAEATTLTSEDKGNK